MGDVIGRGLAAAEVMGRLRSALRAHTLHSDDPAEVLGKLDQQAQQFEFREKIFATVQLAVFEPSLERLHLLGGPPSAGICRA